MSKREKKANTGTQQGTLAAALKEANVTPEAYTVPELGIKPQALFAKVLAGIAEVFGPRALPYHAHDLSVETLHRRGFRLFSGMFKVTPQTDDASLAAIASQIAAAILWDYPEGYVATAVVEQDGFTAVTVNNVTAAFRIEWDASVKAYCLSYHTFVLPQSLA